MKLFSIIALAMQLALFTPSISLAEDEEFITMDEEFNQADRIFTEEGIGEDYTAAGYAKLAAYVQTEADYYRGLEKDNKKRKKTKPFLDYATDVIAQSQTEADKKIAFYVLKRVVYSIWTLDKNRTVARYAYAIDRDPVVDENGVNWKRGLLNGLARLLKPVAGESTAKRLKQLKRTWIPSLNVRIPSMKLGTGEKIGAEQAAKESRFLVDPTNPTVRPNLAEMTVEQMAALELSDNHPAWYSSNGLRKVDAWAAANVANESKITARWLFVERWAEARVSKKLSEDEGKPVQYEISKARRVMFLDSIYTSATSPKAGVEDSYGQDWKLKWGEEIQTEVVANRLWIGLGGKFTDLVYANGPGTDGVSWQEDDGLVLVLRKENAEKRAKVEAKGECYAVDVEEFKSCMMEHYQWAADPAIFNHGTVTDANFEQLIGRHLPEYVKSDAKFKAKQMGKVWITFRESGLEFKSKKAMKRGGAAAYSSVAANVDRMARGGVIFNMWIGNRDAKDDNNKAYILPDFPGMGLTANDSGDLYVESQHDMGYSFGRSLVAGEIKELAGEDFIHRCPTSLSGKICFKEAMGYLPEAWKNATFADALWMAKIVATVTADDLYEIMTYTNWPKFMWIAYVNKMGQRQQALAERFKLEAGIKDSDLIDSYTVDFFGENPLKAEGKDRVVSLAAFAHDLGLTDSLTAAVEGMSDTFSAPFIVNGELNDCWDSILMDYLQKDLYPSGLAQRISRFNDDQTEVGCDADRASFKDVLSGD